MLVGELAVGIVLALVLTFFFLKDGRRFAARATLLLPVRQRATGQRMLDRVGGNPLYAEEYVRMLTDQGRLGLDRAGRVARVDALPPPETVQALVAAYLAHADFEEEAFLPLAATVLGRNDNHMAALGLSLHMRHAPPVTAYI